MRAKCINMLWIAGFPGGRGWIWGSCSDNVNFGENISKPFVDALGNGHDSRAAVNLHNNEAGRLVSVLFLAKAILRTIHFQVELEGLHAV